MNQTTKKATSSATAGGVTVGVDLGDRFSNYSILNDRGEVIEEGRLRTATPAFSQRFSSLPPCRIILEVGTHSPWVSRLLEGMRHDVIVAKDSLINWSTGSGPGRTVMGDGSCGSCGTQVMCG